ncbi:MULTISPECIES: arginine-ornithine antiporter [Exiguobacterium]|uniref:Arginine-ornithine antiporter n=1 Tax=Exiguobacterium antarcticum TaxID=132920 RepID=A0ABT6R1P7_9BACL|nr:MULTISPECIES: arginine-ornithine antiporter [Exiguobacterium]MCT4779195.1 arginine-ornithine antiporter [Exiguobacterium soli]MDI3234870.1 arginine-ornithine antiporter [Exiguobacterium antarcticum]
MVTKPHDTTGTSGTSPAKQQKKLGFFALTAVVVGSMIGGGAFNLAADMAVGASAGAVLIGWVITGIGIIALGLSFQNLTMRRPDLDGGIYSYARAGFGPFVGFNSAWGYWLSAWLGNVAYATLLFSSVGYFFPVFEGGQNLASILGASVLLWLVHALILRGVHEASLVNIITTIAKLVPIFAFITLILFAFNLDQFTFQFFGEGGFNFSSVKEQVVSTMLVTLWVFIGVEGAVVLSGRANKRSDIGKATVIGLIGTLIIYVLISVMSLGVMSNADLATIDRPAMAYILESVVGQWGAVLINIGLVISVLGAWLGWTLLAAEIPYIAAKDGVFPKWFAKENKNEAPVNALWLTNGLIQLFLFTFLISDAAYTFAFSLASSAILIPYAVSAFFQVKVSRGEIGYAPGEKRTRDLMLGLVASAYGIWLIYAAGMDYLLLTTLLYAPGTLLYVKAQREAGIKGLTKWEWTGTAVLTVLAFAALIAMWNGNLSI